MDTEAQHTERDRSSAPAPPEHTSGAAAPEGRSRFALAGRVAEWVPGGWISLTLLACLLFSLFLNS
ncbi:signal peptidase I, partial [Streptomyces sp. NPDC006334]